MLEEGRRVQSEGQESGGIGWRNLGLEDTLSWIKPQVSQLRVNLSLGHRKCL